MRILTDLCGYESALFYFRAKRGNKIFLFPSNARKQDFLISERSEETRFSRREVLNWRDARADDWGGLENHYT